MKPMIQFYATILTYLQSDIEEVGAVNKIVEMAEKVKPSLSETTPEFFTFLEKCVNNSEEVEDDEEWCTFSNDFVKEAFRDLSPIRDERAMEVFHELAGKVLPSYANGEDVFLWASKFKDRPDGSAVVLLHVTDAEKFRNLIEGHNMADTMSGYPCIEDGVQITS